MPQDFRKTLLIVCEGTETEPTYFDGLRDRAMKQVPDHKITISPRPRREREAEKAAAANPVREGGRRRQLRPATHAVGDVPVIPEAYAAQPVRYVWEAQQGLIDGSYDEVWAVFDRDGHPELAQAFALAKQPVGGKIVHLGFSSISFETWILLHFEYNTTDFRRSQCRTQRELHQCGQGIDPRDCHGGECITGYLKTQGHIATNKDIKLIRYDDLEQMTRGALERAYQLRQSTTVGEADVNPFTTVDRLVFKLLQLDVDFVWKEIDQVVVRGLQVSATRDGNILQLQIDNPTNGAVVLQPDYLQLVNAAGQLQSLVTRAIFDPGHSQQWVVDLAQWAAFQFLYLGFSYSELVNGITELPL